MNQNIDNEIVSEGEIQKLYVLGIYARWIIVILLWLILIPWIIYKFEETIFLCHSHCTWAAIRLGLEFNPLATLAIGFCVGIPVATLVKQSIYILRGDFTPKERDYFINKITKIRSQGKNNWLYYWIYGKN